MEGRSSPVPRGYHFDESYREQVRLGDGSSAVLRLIRPSDRAALLKGFERLSPQSRYLRFFSMKATLTDAELSQLVELDGVDRFAIVAMAEGGAEDQVLGVARFARLPSHPELCEPAVTVIDHAQGKGLATVLLARLAAAARERGVERFACEFLAANWPVRHLIEKHARDAVFEHEDEVVRAEVPIPEVSALGPPDAGALGSFMFRLLRESARGKTEIRLRHLLLKTRERER